MTDPELFRQLASYTLWFFAFSFAGWIWEVLVGLVQHGHFVNRGFLYGPVLPIYGVGSIAAIVVLGPVGSALTGPIGVLVQFVTGAVFAGILEYATSWAMEQLFHARWWDYSHNRFNLNGRVCLAGMVIFGTMMVLVERLVHPVLQWITAPLSTIALLCTAAVAATVFLVDLATSVAHMRRFATRLEMIQARLAEAAGNARIAASETRAAAVEQVRGIREAASEQVREVKDAARDLVTDARAAMGEAYDTLAEEVRASRISYLERRAANNPEFAPTRNGEALEWLRELLARR